MNKSLINKTKLLNPGSIGQPRDGSCGASWMMIDFKKYGN